MQQECCTSYPINCHLEECTILFRAKYKLLSYHPFLQGALLAVEADADLDYGQAAKGETLRIVFQVDLPHGVLRRAVQLQLHHVQRGGGAHGHVHPSPRGAYLHVHIHAQQAEDDVEHLLVVSLVVRVCGVGDGGEEGLQQAERAVHVLLHDGPVHFGHHGVGESRSLHIVGEEAPHQPDAYFLVGDVERVEFRQLVIVLDGDVSALVEQGGDALHAFGGGVEVGGDGFRSAYLGRHHVVFPQHLDEVGGRTAAKPVRVHPPVGEGVHQAEGVVDVGGRP